jgi:hypothetical protein
MVRDVPLRFVACGTDGGVDCPVDQSHPGAPVLSGALRTQLDETPCGGRADIGRAAPVHDLQFARYFGPRVVPFVQNLTLSEKLGFQAE